MKNYLWRTLGAVVMIGASLAVSQPASANSQYSAKRSNTVRLVWRRSMHAHTYTATRGARYSKHLGIRYSFNDVTTGVTWTTIGHEKLYNKSKGTSAIYYHVKSTDGTLGGWIWRGYLTSTSATTTTATTTTATTTQSTKAETDPLATTLVKSLVGGAKADPTTMAQAKQVLTQMVSSKYHFSRNMNNTPGWWNGALTEWTGTSDKEQFKQLLADNHLVYGFGYDKTISTAVIGTKDQVLNSLDWETWVEDNMFDGSGTYGVTESNFYVPAKIGVATTKLADGRYAMFSIIRLPAKYHDIALYDE